MINADNYTIYVGEEVNENAQHLIAKFAGSKIAVLVDENTLSNCFPKLVEICPILNKAELIEIESGEENKNIEICTQLWLSLSELQFNRNDLLINLGGGVITDMGGFVASCYKRGISFINFPTTLLAQVDASVGGKTGVDLLNLKNQVGLYSQPLAVYILPEFLKTLPKNQLISGYAEMLKHALIADEEHWKLLVNTDPEMVPINTRLIEQSVNIKNKIVMKDPKEGGKRKILNFGHTIGHAVESYFLENGNTLLHGEAVALGMICEAFLSYKINGLSKEELENIKSKIRKHYSFINLSGIEPEKLIGLMQHDKKNMDKQINFSLLNNIGSCKFNVFVNSDLIIESLGYYNAY